MSSRLLNCSITFVVFFLISLSVKAQSLNPAESKKLKPLILTDYHYLEEVDLQSLPFFHLIKSSFAQIGLEPQIRYLPGRRAFAQVLSGEADGALGLTLRSKTRYPSLELINVPLINMAFYRYWRESESPLNPYCLSRVGAFRGHEVLVDIADQESGCKTPTERVYVTRPKQLMAIVAAGRVDYVVSPLLLDEVIREHFLTMGHLTVGHLAQDKVAQDNQSLVRQSEPFLRVDLYMFLAEKNAHLVQVMEQGFRQYMAEHNYKLTIEEQFQIRAQFQAEK
jgi:hypothetical protein